MNLHTKSQPMNCQETIFSLIPKNCGQNQLWTFLLGTSRHTAPCILVPRAGATWHGGTYRILEPEQQCRRIITWRNFKDAFWYDQKTIRFLFATIVFFLFLNILCWTKIHQYMRFKLPKYYFKMYYSNLGGIDDRNFR